MDTCRWAECSQPACTSLCFMTSLDFQFSVWVAHRKLCASLTPKGWLGAGPLVCDGDTCSVLIVCFWPWNSGELLWEPCGGCVREDDEPSLLGQVQAFDSLKDLPRNDPLTPGCRPGLRHPHPDPHQMAVRPECGRRVVLLTRPLCLPPEHLHRWREICPLGECSSLWAKGFLRGQVFKGIVWTSFQEILGKVPAKCWTFYFLWAPSKTESKPPHEIQDSPFLRGPVLFHLFGFYNVLVFL